MTAASLLILPDQEQKPTTIDEVHLGRMTLGDRGLEREVLEIFARQTILTLKRIAGAEPGTRSRRGPYAKRLRARGWSVAGGAGGRTVGASRREGRRRAMKAAIAELEAASLEVCAAIGMRFGDRRTTLLRGVRPTQRAMLIRSSPALAPGGVSR